MATMAASFSSDFGSAQHTVNSSTGFAASPVKRSPSLTSKLPTARLPRDGPSPGGGKMDVGDRSVLEAIREQAEQDLLESAANLEHTRNPREQAKTPKSKTNSRAASASASRSRLTTHEGSRPEGLVTPSAKSDSPALGMFGGSPTGFMMGGDSFEATPERAGRMLHPEGPQARRRAELQQKYDKAEALRQADQKFIRERNEKFRELRDERFKRLLDTIGDHGGLAQEAAENIRHLEEHQEERRMELHAAYEESVSQPLALQAFNHLNPPNRAMHQRLMGSKSVSWQLPHQTRRLRANVHEDPAKRPVMDHARETAFHQAATSVLGHSSSCPDIIRRSNHLDGLGGSPEMVPRALSRPVFEPTEWSGARLQGSLCGRFAQVCEYGPGFKRAQRGGANVHLPDESDGVPTAGVRTSREHGYGDKGILKGHKASQGETSEHKSHEGASSGAPAQDHYLFQNGSRITDLEFPLGKRIFPEFH
eukprot:gb/GFBE01051356.1/.p1 GENE.gb/GFBE01051356.1/~~gb/GFBE01051356.1/.p1  ORF type:complete len:479 (+),score=67.22 gb/GFBE01051356.1/:1-1437(+)